MLEFWQVTTSSHYDIHSHEGEFIFLHIGILKYINQMHYQSQLEHRNNTHRLWRSDQKVDKNSVFVV